MSDDPSSPQTQVNLELDLAQSFRPAWARESTASEQAQVVERYQEHPRERLRHRSVDRGERKNQFSRRREKPAKHKIKSESLSGWHVQFSPEQRGIEGLARQIKNGMKAYPLFELAWLVLKKPERFLVELKRDSGQELFQVAADGSVWLHKNEATTHILSRQLDIFYRRERIAADPPKGAFSFIAQCGMSGILLGPPNYHDYQSRIRQVHAERFPDVPFETYKSRIQMVKDEESIKNWKEEQSTKEEFYPKEIPEEAESIRLANIAEVERHFRQNYMASAITLVTEKTALSGKAAMEGSSQAVRSLIRRELEELKRFPLALVHALARAFVPMGLQIFKAHENITYVSMARPRYLDRVRTPVAEGLSSILDYVETHPGISRAELWKTLVARSSLLPKAVESAIARDISWLIQQGHIVDYAHRGLEMAQRSVSHASNDSQLEAKTSTAQLAPG